MTTELSVVTYGNGDILREMFNAIAASMGSGSATFSTFIHLTIGFAGTWALVEFITKRSLSVSVRWFAVYFVAFYVVFLPKATVNIIDRVNQGKAYAVDNVPLGLAILASYTSVIGDSLTQLMEQNFSLPDDLRYSQTGMVMASNLVTAASSFQITDPDFQSNIQDFINQCVFYDLLLNKYSAQDLLTTANIPLIQPRSVISNPTAKLCPPPSVVCRNSAITRVSLLPVANHLSSAKAPAKPKH